MEKLDFKNTVIFLIDGLEHTFIHRCDSMDIEYRQLDNDSHIYLIEYRDGMDLKNLMDFKHHIAIELLFDKSILVLERNSLDKHYKNVLTASDVIGSYLIAHSDNIETPNYTEISSLTGHTVLSMRSMLSPAERDKSKMLRLAAVYANRTRMGLSKPIY